MLIRMKTALLNISYVYRHTKNAKRINCRSSSQVDADKIPLKLHATTATYKRKEQPVTSYRGPAFRNYTHGQKCLTLKVTFPWRGYDCRIYDPTRSPSVGVAYSIYHVILLFIVYCGHRFKVTASLALCIVVTSIDPRSPSIGVAYCLFNGI